jgi:hypothetical protein
MRPKVVHGVQVVSEKGPAILTSFGEWLLERQAARERLRQLYERNIAETGRPSQVVEEMVTQAALNYLNKVFFLNLCEDRNLPGFYRIMREFLPTTRSETSPTTAAVFLGMLRRKIQDSVGGWLPGEEAAYRALRHDLAEDIRDRVIEQNNWWEPIRVAFDFAEERFPLVYREDAYDYFSPRKETLAELVYDLSTKSFTQLTNRHVGDIYQGLLSSRRRRRQQARLGAFYTPHDDVEYMVSKLRLTSTTCSSTRPSARSVSCSRRRSGRFPLIPKSTRLPAPKRSSSTRLSATRLTTPASPSTRSRCTRGSTASAMPTGGRAASRPATLTPTRCSSPTASSACVRAVGSV